MNINLFLKFNFLYLVVDNSALLWSRLYSKKCYKNDISLCSVLKAFYYYFWKSSLKKSLIKINKIKFYGHEHFLFIVTRKNRIYYFITINMTFQAGWRHFISFFSVFILGSHKFLGDSWKNGCAFINDFGDVSSCSRNRISENRGHIFVVKGGNPYMTFKFSSSNGASSTAVIR